MRCFALLLTLFVVGCVSPKKIRYVQDIQQIDINQASRVGITLQPDDILTINLASERMEAVSSFYKQSYIPSNSSNSQASRIPEYIIDDQGYIKFPQIGRIELAGLTIAEAEQRLTEVLHPFVNDVSVELRLKNFKVTVLGDVKTPGTFFLEDNHVTLFQALGLAGDLNITGDRKKVKIIRESGDGSKNSEELDLTSASFINTDYYYLKQNDIVIVEPNKSKIQTSGFYSTATFYVSIASILSTLIIVLVTNTR
jgi:polysaccharide export outer membrane protein